MRSGWFWFIAIGVLSLACDSAEAQVAVQQPAFGVFSSGTTVSVPDRGRTFIGGVGRTGMSRSRYGTGPFRSGSSIGVFNEAAGMSVGVTIHDLSELDRQVLAAAGASSKRCETAALPPRAEAAYRVLADRNRDRMKPRTAVSAVR